jgi:Domain of unknown function (DUF4190)
MGTPPDREGQGEGGWQSGGWQSSWQQPTGDQPWQEPAQPTSGPTGGAWQRAPDGSWVQTGQQTSGKSTAALVMGILGLFLCPLICSVLALVFGYQARREIDNSGGRITGRGSATAGIVLGWIGVALVTAFIALVILGLAVGDSVEDGTTPSGEPAVLIMHLR